MPKTLTLNERLEFAAALDKLTKENQSTWETTAATIVNYAHNFLQPQEFLLEITRRSKKQNSSSFTGYTPEAGNVTIHDTNKDRDQNYLGKRMCGPEPTTIGQYLLRLDFRRSSYGHLQFQHFWAHDYQDLLYEEIPRPTYHLFYMQDGLVPVLFGKEYFRIVFRVWIGSYIEWIARTVEEIFRVPTCSLPSSITVGYLLRAYKTG